MKRPLAWLLVIATVSASCATSSPETRWQMYQDEKAAWKAGCTSTPRTRTDCTHVGMMRFAHERWDALIGRVPASDALWTRLEELSADFETEIRAGRATDSPEGIRPWNDRRREIEERYAQDIAQQLADLERDAEARRERVLAALTALGLIAQAVAAAIPARTPSPVYVYPAPAPSAPSRVQLPTPETCTYRLNALRGAMLCVDSRGNVHAR